jgi:hypothetical protein
VKNQQASDNVQSSQQGLSRNKKIALGFGIVFLVLVCACPFLIVAALVYVGTLEPENLELEVEHPRLLQEGDSFELIIRLQNNGDTAISVDHFSLDEAFSGSVLDGAVVEETDPPMRKDYSFNIKDFYYDEVIPPGEGRTVTFYLRTIEVGEFGGSIAAYTGAFEAIYTDVYITVTPE